MLNWIFTLLLLTGCGSSKEQEATVKIFISSNNRRMHTEGNRYFFRQAAKTGFISASEHSYLVIKNGKNTQQVSNTVELTEPGQYEVEYVTNNGEDSVITKRHFVILKNDE